MAPALIHDANSDSNASVHVNRPILKSKASPKIANIDCSNYQQEDDLITDIIRSLKLSGGCLVRGLYSQDTLNAIEKEIRPYINITQKADANRDKFVPSTTKMVTGLLSKSRTYALSVAGNKTWHRVCDHFLTSRLTNSWHGDEARTSVSSPQLSTTVTFSVGPGTQAQGLHRDDDIYHTQQGAAPTHHLGRDTMLCLFVAGKPCTKENGATRVVPGSHLWDYRTVPPPSYNASPEKFSHAEMMPGDAFFMLGGVYHGAGANTMVNEERLVYAAFATRGYLRQEENQYLANDLNKIRELPLDIQRFAGFGTSKPYMGWVDMEEPIKMLNPDIADEETEFW
ncbi:Nn.00g093650.m01.CDS01 [Neocucurbitaria sp. VM-36]